MKEASEIVALVDTSKPLRVVAVTYNSVSGFADGLHRPVNNLEIRVFAGGYVPYNGNFVLARQVMQAAMAGADVREILLSEAGAARNIMAGLATRVAAGDEKPTIYIVYVGRQAFYEAFDFAKELKHDEPQSRVVVVSCNCDYAQRTQFFEHAVAADEVDGYIMGKYCGGHDAMGDAVRALITAYAK